MVRRQLSGAIKGEGIDHMMRDDFSYLVQEKKTVLNQDTILKMHGSFNLMNLEIFNT